VFLNSEHSGTALRNVFSSEPSSYCIHTETFPRWSEQRCLFSCSRKSDEEWKTELSGKQWHRLSLRAAWWSSASKTRCAALGDTSTPRQKSSFISFHQRSGSNMRCRFIAVAALCTVLLELSMQVLRPRRFLQVNALQRLIQGILQQMRMPRVMLEASGLRPTNPPKMSPAEMEKQVRVYGVPEITDEGSF